MDLIGKNLGKYQIRQEIGRGGMGAVYRAYDPGLEREVAVKVLAPHLTWESHFVDRFRREAQMVAALNHPNIVIIHAIGEQGGFHYLVMDLVVGEPLSTIIGRHGPLPPARVARILSQVADALDYAHSRGLIHRDVKPGNILVDSEDRVTLTDFGIARAVEGTRLTLTGMSLGTPQYMSPEQILGNPVDARTDVYSLGVVLYEMLTGRVPFKADTPVAVMHMQTNTPPPSPRTHMPSLPRGVEQVVLRALAKDPEARYSSAGALARAFSETTAGSRSPTTGPFPVAGARRRASTWIYVAAGLASVVLIVGVVLATQNGNGNVAEVTGTATPTGRAPVETMSAVPTVTIRMTPTVTDPQLTPPSTTTATRRTPTATRTRRTPAPTPTHPTPTVTPTRTPTQTATPVPKLVEISASNAAQAKLLETLSGHTLDVLDVALSPDGQTVASASDDKTIRLWRVSDGSTLRVLDRHGDTVYSVAFSPDGSKLVSGSRDNTVRLWRVSNGGLLSTLGGHQAKVWCVAYSPDGKFVASGSGDKTVRIWRASDGRLVHTLSGHNKPIYGLAFSLDGNTLASASADNSIRLWGVSGGQYLAALSGHSDNVRSVDFRDGSTLASASFDRTIQLWQWKTGQRTRTLKGHSDVVLSVVFSQDGDMLASASGDNTVRLWRVSDGKLLKTLQGHKQRVTSVDWSLDGKLIASASDDRTVRLWGVTDY